MNIYLAFFLLVIGFVILIKGADFFVSGASSVARHLGLSTLVVGLTVVAFGTSLPEAAVSISAQIEGLNDVSLGNIVGSNMFNIFLILGVSALFYPLTVKNEILKRDFPISIIAVVLLIIMYFIIPFNSSNAISRYEGAILFIFIIVYVVLIVKNSISKIKLKNEHLLEIETEKEEILLSKQKATLYTIIGLVGVVLGGILVTNGGKEIALYFGMSELLVGITIIAFGTSLPELITSVTAAYKKEVDIAVGNTVGSNIFNIFFILGSSSLIKPILFNKFVLYDLLILLGGSILVFVLALKKKELSKIDGLIMVLVFIAYFSFVIMREMSLI